MEVLPNDLVRKCLLGVPYTSHDNLKAVCRSWEGMVSNTQFYADRNISGKSEQLICLIHKDLKAVGDNLVITIYNPLNGTWKRLPTIDDPHFTGISIWSQCVAVNRKLVLITGVVPSSRTMKSVYIYDFEWARWTRGADMPTPRSFFACSVPTSSGLVYVASGINESLNSLSAAETYNVEEDKWEILRPMIQRHGPGCHCVFMERKFMVLTRTFQSNTSVEVFNPSTGTWEDMQTWEGVQNFTDDLWNTFGAASSSGNLYLFSKHNVMKYDRENNVRTFVVSLRHLNSFITCVTEWHDCIFVSTITFTPQKHMMISYMFNPSTGGWIQVNGDEEASVGIVVCATTLKICKRFVVLFLSSYLLCRLKLAGLNSEFS